jgi:hypothetical protein
VRRKEAGGSVRTEQTDAESERELAKIVAFLVWYGFSKSDVYAMTLRQLELWQKSASEIIKAMNGASAKNT